jgi:hypothetical protein
MTAVLSDRVVDRGSAWLARRFGRRGFLARTAIVGSALAASPLRYLFRPGTAYAALCGPDADCGSGWTVMCCSINGGENRCPDGTIAAGWWKADNSGFCNGAPRYYIDCNATCSCDCGPSGICAPECQNCGCRCNTGSCDQRAVCCNQFRYGQCHQEVRCVGAVVCRVVSCTPPWEYDPSCTTVAATANATALHDAPCLHDLGNVFGYGRAEHHGQPPVELHAPIAGMEATPTGRGYWLAASDGGIFAFGDARFLGSMGGTRLARPVVDLAVTPTGRGYWLAASDGGIFAFGDARFLGSMGGTRLAAPVAGIAATPTGRGYWLAASDGGIFAFGDARFLGSMGGTRLAAPVAGIAATPTGRGYWLAASDGGIFAFGDARFLGSLAGLRLAAPIVAIASTPTGKGYWMVGADGGVFALGDAEFYGSLSLDGSARAVDVTRRPAGGGYWVTTDVAT